MRRSGTQAKNATQKRRSRRISSIALSLQDADKGVKGVLEASKNFRAAILDLKAKIEELLVVHDRAVVRYSFTGHFTGSFKDLKGDGREISFRAVDIYRVQNGQISDNWHLEDNLSLMQQLGVVTP